MGTPFSSDNFDFLDLKGSDNYTSGSLFRLGFYGGPNCVTDQPDLYSALLDYFQLQGQGFTEHRPDDNAYGCASSGWELHADLHVAYRESAAQQVQVSTASTNTPRRSGRRPTNTSNRRNPAGVNNRWDSKWRAIFLEAVLTIGIGNAKTMDILGFLRERHPAYCLDHKIKKEHVESYWQNFRRKLRKQYGLPKNEIPGNEHVPKLEDIPEHLRPLAEYWLRQSHPK